eukprot:2742095-Rhodomonas_salina.6
MAFFYSTASKPLLAQGNVSPRTPRTDSETTFGQGTYPGTRYQIPATEGAGNGWKRFVRAPFLRRRDARVFYNAPQSWDSLEKKTFLAKLENKYTKSGNAKQNVTILTLLTNQIGIPAGFWVDLGFLGTRYPGTYTYLHPDMHTWVGIPTRRRRVSDRSVEDFPLRTSYPGARSRYPGTRQE